MASVSLTSSVAQEPNRDEFVDEINNEIKQSEARLSNSQVRAKLLAEKIEWLKNRRSAHVAIVKLESKIEAVDRSDREVEKLTREVQLLDWDAEEADLRVDLLNDRLDIHSMLLTLPFDEADSDLSELRMEVNRINSIQNERLATGLRLFDVYREGPKSKEARLEAAVKKLASVFERKRQLLELKAELWWAIEEGDDELVEELEDELAERLKRKNGPTEPQEAEQPSESTAIPLSFKTLVVTEAEIEAAGNVDFDTTIVPLLQEHCFECHDADSASGELNLEGMLQNRPLVVHRERWQNVMRQIAVGSMPPAESPRIKIDDRRQLVASLSHAVKRFDYRTVRTVGFEPARRLTHQEYDNAVSDLFGIRLNPTERFPVDMTSQSGFDNNAESLSIQPLLIERYVSAAEYVVDAALPVSATTEQHRLVRERLIGNQSMRQATLDLAARAFRRPLEKDESRALRERFDSELIESGSEITALRRLAQVILISPSFLIRSESIPGGTTERSHRINDFELASRLSFFLWSSIPDGELAHVASNRDLSDPAVITRQIERMLIDPRSKSLGDRFAIQWLGLSNLHRVQRDPIDNPWATDSLVAAMREETALFFHSLVLEDAPIERLIDANYTYLNDELANHYQIDAELGNEMQRVELHDQRRGGILAQGGVLAITSFPHRTSPVARGNWILTTLLGTPPPPPPPNVSEFNEELAENRRMSSRERLRRHRDNPNCYACHSQIDPLGFALERFDWFGRYRQGGNVDVRGKLPDGQSFVGLKGLKETLLRQRRDDLVRQLTRMMFSYALGRTIDYRDEATINEVIENLESEDRRLQSLIRLIVQSDTFQMQHVSRQSESK